MTYHGERRFMARLAPGDQAPDFELADQNGQPGETLGFSRPEVTALFLPQGGHAGLHPSGVQHPGRPGGVARTWGWRWWGSAPIRPTSRKNLTTNTGWPFPCWRTRSATPPRPTAPGAKRTLRQEGRGDYPIVIFDRCGGEDHAGLVQGRAGRHGSQGQKGPGGS